MKAGVKEGDRIIKVSEIPSLGDPPPPWGRGVQGHFWPWPVLYTCVFIASVVSRCPGGWSHENE